VQQLFPIPAAGEGDAVDLDDLYGLPRPSLSGRPWVGLCMIASLDGSTAVAGRSGGLGNADDQHVFAALRRVADVVLVGARTAVAERYGAPNPPGLRIGVVTASGNVAVTTDLFTAGAGFLVMPEGAIPAPELAGVDVVRAGTAGVDLPLALARLADVVSSPSFVLAEGGPGLNGSLLDAGCVDEVNLSLAPYLEGGDGARLVAGASEDLRGYQLAHVLTDSDGYLFTRWVRAAA
jgi:riboflavin biosynthesis pyrimidine reductase